MPVFNAPIVTKKIPVVGLVPERASSAPSSPVEGQLWVDTSITPARLKVYENGAWVLVSQTGGVLTGDSAGGDLSGPFSNLQINTGAVGAAEIADGTITDTEVAAANKDGLAATPSLRTLGTGAQQAAAGNDARFTDSRTPSGTAGGDLAGSYPNPTIATGAVDYDELADTLNDPAAASPGLRTLGTGAQQALPGNTRLDQVSAPTAPVSLNGQRLTNLGTPTADTDAATKAYVDAARSGLDVKESVRAATTADITLSGTQTIDDVAVVAGDRVLVKNQTTSSDNGIYVAAAGVWARAADADSSAEVNSGMFTFVEEGTTNGDSGWVLTTNNPITLGTTALTFGQFSGTGQIIAGDGLTKSGNTIDVVGTTDRITVAADNIDIASNYAGQTSIDTLGTVTTGTWSATTIAVNKGGTGATTAAGARTNLGATGKYAADLGAMTAGSELTVTHSLNTTDVTVQVKNISTGYYEEFDVRTIDANSVGITSALSYASSTYRVVVVG